MAAMAGSGSFWMANWQPCTPVEVLKVARTAQVSVLYANLYVSSIGILQIIFIIIRTTNLLTEDQPPLS